MKNKGMLRGAVRAVCAVLALGSTFAVTGCNPTEGLVAAISGTADGLIQNVLDGFLGALPGQGQ